jgi:hypothetical protein
MIAGLPFPIEIVFLLLVLPIGFAYLVSVAGVGLLCLRRSARALVVRLRLRVPQDRQPGA